MTHHCPVCGLELDFAPWHGESPSDEICPCCGIQFGYTDLIGATPEGRALIYHGFRVSWMLDDMPWRGASDPPPGWDPEEQLNALFERRRR